MKRSKRIITFFLSLAIVFTLCLPALAAPAEAAAPAAAFDQVGSDTSITLNNGDVLRVPSEAITGNYIVYRVNNGVYRYYVIDVFESTDGVKEMAFLSFTRYVGQHAITNANALSPNVWTIYGMQNVLYAISGALTVRPMYSTFDYYDALGFLLIGAAGSDHTEDEFASTLLVESPTFSASLPRELAGSNFMVVDVSGVQNQTSMRVFEFPELESNLLTEGDVSTYIDHYIAKANVTVSFTASHYDNKNYTVSLPTNYTAANWPYCYLVGVRSGATYFFVSTQPATYISSSDPFRLPSVGKYLQYTNSTPSGNWSGGSYKLCTNTAWGSSSYNTVILWSNTDICDSSGNVMFPAFSSSVSNTEYQWGSDTYPDALTAIIQNGWDIKYSTFDYYDKNGDLYFSNSFAGEVTEDDQLINLILDDGTVIRVPDRFGERDSYFLVMDPVGGTEETAYLIYEFDYYEGVADGTVCDFTRWYGVATTTDDVTSWEWNYQDYYVTELDILDYGPIVYSTFEYVDGRMDEEEEPSDDGATSEEVKGFWNKLLAKLDEILKAIKELAGIEPDSDCEHTYTSEIQREATCSTPGHMLYTCGNCGHKYTELIEPIGHDWIVQEHEDEVLDEEGNVVEKGYDRVVCSVCKLETKDYGDGPIESDLFDAIGDLLAGAVDWILDKLAQLTDSLTGITDSFNSYLEQIKGLSGNYGLFFGEFLALLPKDFMSVVWFGVIAGIVGLVWKAWM